VFQSIGSQPYQGSFAHTSTNTFFKEDHNHSKKVLKGFLCTAVSLKMTLDSFQINAALLIQGGCTHILGEKELAAQGMYWRMLI
jgi:hypothetical protein